MGTNFQWDLNQIKWFSYRKLSLSRPQYVKGHIPHWCFTTQYLDDVVLFRSLCIIPAICQLSKRILPRIFFFFFLRGIACVIIQRMEELALHQALIDSFSFSLHNIQQTACGKGCEMQHQLTGPRLNIKTVFLGMEMSVLKIRRSRDRLIFNMGTPILLRRHFILTRPRGGMVPYWQSYSPRVRNA